MANTTIIQIKRSYANTVPQILHDGELAYSFVSNTLYIGDSTNTAVSVTDVATANTAKEAFKKANSAYDQANSAATYANGSFEEANAAYAYANTIIPTLNPIINSLDSHISAVDTFGQGSFTQANAAFAQANSAYGVANTALQQSGGSITGSLSLSGDLTVSGNATFLGNATYIRTTTLDVYDSLIYLANNNFTSDAVDIGIIGHYNNGANAHSGVFRDPSRKEWIFFKDYTPEVNSNNLINIAHPSFIYANVWANTFKGDVIANNVTINGYNAFTYITNAYAQANSAASYANSAFSKANSAYGSQNTTGTYANSAYTQANTATTNAAAASSYANSAYTQANTATTNAATADSKAVTAGSYANSAYTQANTATTNAAAASSYANSAYTQANTATTNAAAASSYANSAYTQANTATTDAATADSKAVTAGNYANSAYTQANTATTDAATADSKAVTAGSYANSAYTQANTATTNAAAASSYANSAYTQANTATTDAATADSKAVTAGSYANSAYTQANTATTNAAAASSYANSAYTQANTGTTNAAAASSYANSAYTQANTGTTNAAAASSYANSAYTQANTATTNAATADSKAVTAGSYANSAYAQANGASIYANGAFSYANSAYTRANNSINANTGGTITADLIVTGNLTIGANVTANYITGTLTNTTIAAGAYNYVFDTTGALTFDSTKAATSNSTGALVIPGGVGVKGNLYSGNVYITGASNGIIFADGTTLSSAPPPAAIANSSAIYANGAFTQANAAFLQANTVFTQANATSIRTDGAFVQANSAYTAANIGKTFVENGGTINGSVLISQDLNVSGNIVFGGNSTSISSNNLTLSDSLIYLANNNSGNTVDIGIVGHFIQGNYQHTTVFRDHLDGRWKFVSNVIPEPSQTIDLTDPNIHWDILKSGGIETVNYANVGTIMYVGSKTGAALGGSINPVIAALGNSTGYIQNYIFNSANGSSSSSDMAAYPNNGQDTSGWIDMGITSNNFTDSSYSVTGRNEGYLFMSAPAASGTSGNLILATDSTGTYNAVEFYIAGFGQGKTNPVLTLDSTKVKTNKQIQFVDNTLQNTAAAPYAYSNAAFLQANSAYTKANNALANTTGIFGGDLTISGNLIVAGANVALGNVGNVHIYGGDAGQILVTDNNGNLSFIDLPTTSTTTYTADTLTLTNGVYVSGSVTDTQVLNDGNSYQITDGSGAGPAWIITTTYSGVVAFNRVVANIDYTVSSGHTIYFQVYNYTTSSWDNIGSYSGASGYSQYALEVLGYTSYISAGAVQVRLYHNNAGSVSHATKLDYIALELSAQGAQGPRGPTGATGATGAGVATGGTAGQVMVKNSSTNYDTSWSSDLIDSYAKANSAALYANGAFSYANSAYTQANTATTNAAAASSYANSAYTQANTATTNAAAASSYANSAYTQANTATTNAATADSKAVTAGSYANSAYAQANSAALYANGAFSYANSAYTKANTIGTLGTQSSSSVTITGGTIDGTIIGGTTAANGSFTTITANSNTSITTVIAVTAAVTANIIATFDAAQFRTIKLHVQAVDSIGAKYHSTELMALHNGTTANHTEYASVYLGGLCATYDMDYSTGIVRLIATPTSANSTTYKIFATQIKV